METACDLPPPSQSGRAAWCRHLPWGALAVILIVYGLHLRAHWWPAIVTPDANGYWAQGTMLAETGQTWFRQETPLRYIGMHWLVSPDKRYLSRYPPGLAVAVAAVDTVAGYEATLLINPALALLTLVAVFLLTRTLIGSWWGVGAAALLALTPTFTRHALTCDSHMAVTALLAWGLYLLAAWSVDGGWWRALAAGMLLGAIPTVRYPEALYGLGVAAFFVLHARRHRQWWLHLLIASAGAAIPIGALMVRNHLAFGAFWRTAYAFTNEQTGFGANYFRAHAIQYVQNLGGEGIGLFFALGLVGMAVMAATAESRPLGWLMLLVTVPITLLYMAYYWAPAQMTAGTMRFLLPTFLCYLIAGLWLLRQLAVHLPRSAAIAAVAVAMIVQAVWGGMADGETLDRLALQKRQLALVTDQVRAEVAEGSVVFGSRALLEHLDSVQRWKLAETSFLLASQRPGIMAMRSRLGNAESSTEPRPMQSGKQAQQVEAYAGLFGYDLEMAIAEDVRRWAGGHDIYFVGTPEELAELDGPGLYFYAERFDVVTRVALPEAPAAPTRRDDVAMVGDGPPDGPPDGRGQRFGQRRPGGGGGPGRGLIGVSEIAIARYRPPWTPE